MRTGEGAPAAGPPGEQEGAARQLLQGLCRQLALQEGSTVAALRRIEGHPQQLQQRKHHLPALLHVACHGSGMGTVGTGYPRHYKA